MLKKIVKASIVLIFVGTLFFLFPPHFSSVSATDTTFQVNVREVLSVSITTPTAWAKGEVDDFLRNKVTLSVTSNNINGFTALMNTEDNAANLYHSSKANTVLQTLSSDNVTRSAFPANRWGYSIDDNDNNNGAGIDTSHYSKLVGASATPISLISNAQSTGESPITSRNIYFGAKSDITQASGTYSGTIVFNIISGVLPTDENDPPNPVIPANPATDVANGETVTDTTNNRVVSTVVTTDDQADTTTTTTTVSEYVAPQGVTDTTSANIYDGSMLTTGLAVTASVAAASGIFFFILAKRKKDDDDEEETV